MMTDPISDMLTRIRNANAARLRKVDIPASRMKQALAELLLREGYIKAVKVVEQKPQGVIRVYLKYTADRQPVIEGIQRVSKPGLRIYAQRSTIPRVLGGYGTSVISTSKGIVTGHQARMMGLGGEVVCKIW